MDLAALRANFRLLRSLADGLEILAVVKADAYGHGAIEVAESLAAEGCQTLAVVTISEAEQLRKGGVTLSIMLLGGVLDKAEATRALELRVTPVVHRKDELSLISEAAKELEFEKAAETRDQILRLETLALEL